MIQAPSSTRWAVKYIVALLLFACYAATVSAADGVTWHVPAQCPTIQAGIDSASAGDTVLVAYGTYYDCTHMAGPTLHCVIMKPGVCLRSETGQPECVTIDAQQKGRVVLCENADHTTSIEGFTITGGLLPNTPDLLRGAGMYCTNSHPQVTDCVFSGNSAYWSAGGMSCINSDVSLTHCVFTDNSAEVWGGGLALSNCSPTLVSCTFSGNSAGGATSIYMYYRCSPLLEKTIIAFGLGGETVHCDGTSSPAFSCCDIYGNQGGDWVGSIADQYGVNGNFSECPLFCDPELEDFGLQVCSPCAPGNHPDGYECGLIGAFDVGCDCGLPSRVHPTTWSSVKAAYR
jgi:hypothetical protein